MDLFRDRGSNNEPGSRHRVLLTGSVILVIVGVLVAGFILLRMTQSPAQRVADAQPPPKPVVTASVEQRRLAVEATLSGTVEATGGTQVAVPSLPSDGKLVVTGTSVAPGDTVSAGTVVAEVSGFPIVAVPGKFPMYRSFGEGDRGVDVSQLQSALKQLGFSVTDSDGVFGRSTTRAVVKLFTNRHLDSSILYSDEDSPRSADSETDHADAGQKSTATAPQGDTKTVRVPEGVFAFISDLPATVGSVDARVGAVLEADATVLTLVADGVQIASEVPETTASAIRPGMACTITASSREGTSACTVASIDESKQEGSKRIIIDPADSDELPPETALTIAVEIEASRGDVLAVPVTAVRSDPDGSSYVTVQTEDGPTRKDIEVGQTIGGWTEITGGGVVEGDTIVLQ